ncbi:winged helix-turn-helix domain-containing protein [Niabella insulamsoli]|uniref:winged helix-turn-helix domain-containing protein n=1 Tax=Niabella insulamsoli TaxID=3144874 RepID=UPI0031FE1C4F
MTSISIINSVQLSKVEQIAESLRKEIEKGRLKKNDQLLSINEFSEQYQFARDTVEKAYKILKKQGLIHSVPGKGYFVLGKPSKKLKVLLVMNKISAYKKIVYNTLIETFGGEVHISLHIHHYNIKLLKEIIEANLGKYHYFIIMPHFTYDVKQKEIKDLLSLIPDQELVTLDKKVGGLKKDCIEIFQDFENDIYHALKDAQERLSKYKKISVILREDGCHPREILKGINRFCEESGKAFEVLPDAENLKLQKKVLYIDTSEYDLALLIKKAHQKEYQLGRDIGILSFNETVLKDVLDIAVVTTDFEELGRKAATCILKNETGKFKNPFQLIKRRSI